jgi:hypothetical protein
MSGVAIGADPEIFLKKGRSFVSAHTLIPGDKRKPHKVKRGAVQVDGTAAEFNIDPAMSAAEFVTNLDTVLKQMRAMIPDEYEFAFEPTARFPKKYFENLPEECKVLGCDPDYSVAGEVNPTPKPVDLLRHGGGHIHVGWTRDQDVKGNPDHFWDCIQVAKNFQHVFGDVQTLWDSDTFRSEVYGNGSFRPKPYGCEIRSFSNAWVKYPKLWPWLWDMSTKIIDDMKHGKEAKKIYYYREQDVRYINNQLKRYDYPQIPVDFMKV